MTDKIRTQQGRVISDKMDKSIVVAIERMVKHPIYGKFIKQGSLYEVNINGSTRRLMEEKLAQGKFTCEFFDSAFEEVYHLLVSWSLPRFLRRLNQSMEFRTPQ